MLTLPVSWAWTLTLQQPLLPVVQLALLIAVAVTEAPTMGASGEEAAL
jgi:hypothetical protein